MSLFERIQKWFTAEEKEGLIVESFDPRNRPVRLESIAGEFVVKVDGVAVGSFTTVEEATACFEIRIVDSNRNL